MSPRPARRPLTVVMYHYVRPIAGSAYPTIKGLELSDFRRQLDHFLRKYRVIEPGRLHSAMHGAEPLPERALLLTFDDGYRDHMDHVVPLLIERGVSGLFFPPAQAIRDRRALPVNKIHFILASVANPDGLLDEVEDFLSETLDPPGGFRFWWSELKASHGSPNRFDTPRVSFLKRLLQFALPEDIRLSCVDLLFERHVGVSESKFVDELYMTPDDVRSLAESGMGVGSHGSRHGWLNQMTEQEQRDDIDDAEDFLDKLGIPRDGRTFCYPYGGYDEATLEILRELGYAAAFTTNPRRFDPYRDDPLEIPRFDTNDFIPIADRDPRA